MNFYRRVAIVCRKIPTGKVVTYGQIALLCGFPRNARQVGYALGHGLAGEKAPAYRVVNAKGILSGAASFATAELQKQMLEKEGIQVIRAENGWRVDLKKDGWHNTMEDAIFLRAQFEEAGI